MAFLSWLKKAKVRHDSSADYRHWRASERPISEAQLEKQAKIFVKRYGEMIEKLSHE